MTVRFVSGAVTVVAAAMLTTGCAMLTEDPYAPTSVEDTARAAEVLVELPSLEEVEATLTAAIEEIAAGATALEPRLMWEWTNQRGESGCAPPYDQTEGEFVYLSTLISGNSSISDELWPRVFDLARVTAVKIGATKVEIHADRPGHHVARFYNETGTSIRIGSQVAATITGDTGCRLPQAKILPN